VVTVGAVTDLAGNPLPTLGGWVVKALIDHPIMFSGSSPVMTAPGRVTLRGRTDASVGGPLLLEESVADGPWGAIASLRQDSSGAFALTVPLIGSTSFRVHFVGSDTEAEALSAAVRVLLRRGVTISTPSVAVPRIAAVGQTLPLTVTLEPLPPESSVTLTILVRDSKSGAWRQISTVTRRTVRGTATFTWHPALRGSYQVRASTAPSARFANGLAVAAWTVR
jgi:hypothetical protein